MDDAHEPLLDLEGVRTEVNKRAAIVGASGDLLPTYSRSEDFGRPNIERDERGFHYVVVERGVKLERFTTTNLDELLEHIFCAITQDLAGRYAATHRGHGDSRRVLFPRQLELLGNLSPAWAERERARQLAVLRDSPFHDA